ncbi:transglycosylase SLT domain-containing protein [Mesobacillus foraminis]|uniref:Ig-like domain-containing protein n=1 Tax=Mesobacillus foraminis TaxID=279826 RepID=UPI001BEC33C1|nr:Ig-like domain-containing protein [Mesobacillus foraminis]MBT2757429.1 transglycosylase SLT domain-containing protein [Mesobacillus foraminis]
MRLSLLKAGVLTCFMFLGVSNGEASAETTWPAKCASFGEMKANQNPSPQHVNCLLTNAALEADIPPEVVKAVAEKESSGWRQFDADGQPVISTDGGIGLMQITNQSKYDQEKLKTDISYNIQAGVEVLNSMYLRKDLPKIKGAGRDVIENWYFPVMAYNGTKPVNSPLKQADGSKNTDAYQEQVFALIEKNSFLDDTELADFPFNRADFQYLTDSTQNIVFKKLEYTISGQMHTSTSLFKTGDRVVTTLATNLRSHPTSGSSSNQLAENTPLVITGDFIYDQSFVSKNQFVWYPVKTADQKLTGYVSSAYLAKQLDPPSVSTVDDNDRVITGKAPANATVQVMNGSKQIGRSVAGKDGTFTVNIPVQKAGTQLTITYKDMLNAESPATAIKVMDKTPPSILTINTITNKSKEVTGKTEANATVTLSVAGKSYIKAADKYGTYKIAIPVQNTGTVLSLTVKDIAKNSSAVKKVKVVRAAPNIPVVNKVSNKAAAVTGKTEANATVTVSVAGKNYSKQADKYGNYKVSIPVQNTGTSLSVTAKDSKGKVSIARKAAIVRAAPNMPGVNKVSNKTTTVTGKTEAFATVKVSIAGKSYSKKADKYGNYKVTIPVQNAGTSLSVTAKDSKGHTSAARTLKISRVAPNMPTVNKVKSTSAAVSGKTEKNAKVTVKIGTKTYTAKANAYGNYKVSIPKQKAGKKLSVTAKDAKGQVSAARTVTVSK